MDKFLVYDVVLLVLFVLFMSWFLYTRKHNLKKEGLLYLYRAQWGVKLIDTIGKKYKKTLTFFSYVAIIVGYILMASMIYLFGRIVWIYIFEPAIVQQIKVPPIIPLIPYLPQIFKLDFLPPFYFTYWIIILAVVAITHEFAHGIFMKRYNIKIKSTGFGFFPWFLPIFLAAFVEQDEKSMNKAKNFEQRAVLAAGTFANILTSILFLFVLWGFFSLAYNPVGVQFDNYAYGVVNISMISSINNMPVHNPTIQDILGKATNESLNDITIGDQEFIADKEFLQKQENNTGLIILYLDAPAARSRMIGAISEIDNNKITNINELGLALNKYSPGDKIKVKTLTADGESNYEITLGEYPGNFSRAWLGVAFADRSGSGIRGLIYSVMSSFKNPNTYYAPLFGAADYIYNLLWWMILICISVALVNMLPMGIFDGGMFFYLTILSITKNEKIAKVAFVGVTYFILFLIFLLMAFWAIAIF
ncbi:MAG: site-2 protease family protein [Nanoarchaeota archaeon]